LWRAWCLVALRHPQTWRFLCWRSTRCPIRSPYGSEGWGFESLRARDCGVGERGLGPRRPQSLSRTPETQGDIWVRMGLLGGHIAFAAGNDVMTDESSRCQPATSRMARLRRSGRRRASSGTFMVGTVDRIGRPCWPDRVTRTGSPPAGSRQPRGEVIEVPTSGTSGMARLKGAEVEYAPT